jgi:Pyruvate/2-oxoacid:ferredoxin oxidoreductase delta subunit
MKDNLPVIDYAKCTGCGTCAQVCPKHTIAVTDKTDNVCEAVNS